MHSPVSALSGLRRPMAVLTVAATAASLTGCGIVNRLVGGGDDPFDLVVGDCITETVGYEVDSVEIVDCREPHYSEVYQSFIIDDGPYPGDDEVSMLADDWCYEDFYDFVGVDYTESVLGYETLFPSEDTWNNMNDREVLCLIFDPAGDTVGTLQGANI
jgi:hypothetical protein